MIIVNQNRNIVVPFKNIVSIYVQEKNVQVLLEFIEDALILGKYNSNERAEEVLQEIIDRYTNWENLKAGQPSGLCNPKYEMPLE